MKLAPLLVALFATTSLAQPTASSPASRYDAAFLLGDTQVIWDAASPGLKKLMGSPQEIADLRRTYFGDKPQLTTEPEISRTAGTTTLVRTIKGAGGQTLDLTFTVTNKTGELAGMLIAPAKGPPREAPSTFLNYKTKSTLRLPFDNTWTVAWGGRTIKQNYHAIAPDQRFAYDLFIVKDNSTHAGDGRRLEDYHCFNQPILAPANATVLSVVADLPDQSPGEMDPTNAMGNHVVLDLGNDEYLFLCHLKQNSLKVAKGDKVTPGQTLGLCGNSGNTSEPHLHLHLQNTPTPFRGKGLPCQFQHYTADDQPVDRGEPTRTQRITPISKAQ